MTPLKSSLSDGTIWSIMLESSIMILEASFTLIYDVYSTGITYDDHQLTIVNVYSTGPNSSLGYKTFRGFNKFRTG
jgi:hypothetical protein